MVLRTMVLRTTVLRTIVPRTMGITPAVAPLQATVTLQALAVIARIFSNLSVSVMKNLALTRA